MIDKAPCLRKFAQTGYLPLKFGGNQKSAKKLQNSQWGFELGPAGWKAGVPTPIPYRHSCKYNLNFFE